MGLHIKVLRCSLNRYHLFHLMWFIEADKFLFVYRDIAQELRHVSCPTHMYMANFRRDKCPTYDSLSWNGMWSIWLQNWNRWSQQGLKFQRTNTSLILNSSYTTYAWNPVKTLILEISYNKTIFKVLFHSWNT